MASYWNPADKSPDAILSGDHKTLTHSAAAPYTYENARSVKSYSSGKYCFRLTITTDTLGSTGAGLADAAFVIDGANWLGIDTHGICGYIADHWYYNGNWADGLRSVGSNTDMLVAADLDNKLIWARPFSGGDWNDDPSANPATGTAGASFSGITGPFYVSCNISGSAVQSTAVLDTVLAGVTLPSGFVPWEADAPAGVAGTLAAIEGADSANFAGTFGILDLGTLAVGGSVVANQTTLSVATTAACAAGELVVVWIAVDNNAPGGTPENEVATAQVTIGGELLIRADGSGPNTSPQTGPAVVCWWGVLASAKPSGTNIDVLFVSPTQSDHTALTARRFSVPSGNTIAVAGTARRYQGAPTDPLPLDVTTVDGRYLRTRGVAYKLGTVPPLTFTPTTLWTAWSAGNCRPDTPGAGDWRIDARVEHLIFTSTNGTSDPSLSATAANANAYVAFLVSQIVTLAATDGADSASFAGTVAYPVTGTLAAIEARDIADFGGAGFRITDLGVLAAGGSRAANQTTLIVPTTATVNAGELLVVVVAVDNRTGSPSNSDDSVSVVTVGPNTLIKVDGCTTETSSPQIAPAVSIWYCIPSAILAVGTNINVTFVNVATSDHSALAARHFSCAPASITPDLSVRFFSNTAIDYPSMDLTTANAERLRIRAVGVRYPNGSTPGFSNTADWASWNVGYSGDPSTSPNWEIYANAESIVFTGTNKVSDPIAYFTVALNANVYATFKAVPPPVTSVTLSATEGGSDSASFGGNVISVGYGTIEAYEGAVWPTADSTLYTADDDVTRVNTATIIRDAASFAGQVLTGPIGVIAATEGADTAAFTGTAITYCALNAVESADVASFAATARMLGTLAATEDADTAQFSAAAFFPVTAILDVTEDADVAAFTVAVSAFGALAVTEGSDVCDFDAFLSNNGSFAAVEEADVVEFDGWVAWTGTLAATEDTNDSVDFSGVTAAMAGIAATEGADTVLFEGYLSRLDEKIGILNAFEDKLGGYAEPHADSTLITADNTLFHASIEYYGIDFASFTGEISVTATLVAMELEQDDPTFRVNVPLGGALAATEAGDTAGFTGTTRMIIRAVLAAQEAMDRALFSEPLLEQTGVLGAVEGADTALFMIPTWEEVGEGAGLKNEVMRMSWLEGKGGRVTWLEGEVGDTSWLQNLDPEVVSLLAEQRRITELRP